MCGSYLTPIHLDTFSPTAGTVSSVHRGTNTPLTDCSLRPSPAPFWFLPAKKSWKLLELRGQIPPTGLELGHGDLGAIDLVPLGECGR
jgi:hypothetical protein